jgi:hypothetical protein
LPLLATTFGSKKEFERGRAVLDRLSLAYEVLSPDPGFRHVGAPQESPVMASDMGG